MNEELFLAIPSNNLVTHKAFTPSLILYDSKALDFYKLCVIRMNKKYTSYSDRKILEYNKGIILYVKSNCSLNGVTLYSGNLVALIHDTFAVMSYAMNFGREYNYDRENATSSVFTKSVRAATKNEIRKFEIAEHDYFNKQGLVNNNTKSLAEIKKSKAKKR